MKWWWFVLTHIMAPNNSRNYPNTISKSSILKNGRSINEEHSILSILLKVRSMMKLVKNLWKQCKLKERISFEIEMKNEKRQWIKLWERTPFQSTNEKFLWIDQLLRRKRKRQDQSLRIIYSKLKSSLRSTSNEFKLHQILVNHYTSRLKI